MKFDLYQRWLRNSGLIKKLHLSIFILSLLLLVSIMQLVSLNKKIADYSQRAGDNIKVKEAASDISKTTNLQNFDSHSFIKTYLERFFGTNDSDFNFISDKTESGLYVQKVYPELKARQKLALQSKFKLKNIISEDYGSNSIKFICFGREIFTNQEYQDRSLIIELVVDLNTRKVIAIPVLKVE